MYDELFKVPTVVARYRAGPVCGIPRAISQEGACGRLFAGDGGAHGVGVAGRCGDSSRDDRGTHNVQAAEEVHFSGTSGRSAQGRPPSPHTIKLILQSGKPWLRSMGALVDEPKRPQRFATELFAYKQYMRVERGLSPVTITSRDEAIRWFCRVLAISGAIARCGHHCACRCVSGERKRADGWSRRSLHCARLQFAQLSSATLRIRDGVDPISRESLICRISMRSKTFLGRRALSRLTGFSKTSPPATIRSTSGIMQSCCC